MQNKGAIIILAIALGLVSIYQLSFTVATYKVKQEAKNYAKGNLIKETTYLDSIATLPKEKWSYFGYTFKECQKKELNLGLDLKGGMNVIMEVSIEDILKALSNYNPDKSFNAALALAKQRQRQSQSDFLTLFGKAFQEIDPNARLASIFGTVELKEKINFNSTNDEVMKVLDGEVNTAITNAFNILRTRIDRYGVVQPNISQLATKGRILVELPGVKNPKRIRELLVGTANLEFWETYENGEIINYLSAANNLLKEIAINTKKATADSLKIAKKIITPKDSTKKKEESLLDIIQKDTTKAVEAQNLEQFTQQNPLFGLLRPFVNQQGQAQPGSLDRSCQFQGYCKSQRISEHEPDKSAFPKRSEIHVESKPI
jgi:SecD/SecF fusion protein